MLYQLSYAHHTLIGNSLTLFLSGCFCFHVCNRRQFGDFIRMEFGPRMGISSNHSVTAMPNPKSMQAYLQGVGDGQVARPEITGNDLADLTYFVLRNSLAGGVANLAVPNSPSCTGNAPSFTSFTGSNGALPKVTTGSGGTATVCWNADVQSLGIVQWGTNSGQYFGFQFENASTQYVI